jgi:hypothetical protein
LPFLELTSKNLIDSDRTACEYDRLSATEVSSGVSVTSDISAIDSTLCCNCISVDATSAVWLGVPVDPALLAAVLDFRFFG